MKNVLLAELFTETKPIGVSIRPSLALELPKVEAISSNNIIVSREIATPAQKLEYLPVINRTVLDSLNRKKTIDAENTQIFTQISNFNIIGNIELQGKYSQNIVKFPKFKLNTNIKTLPDINFRFILSIKKTDSDSNPTLYTSDKFYNELASTYWENNPYMVANAIKSPAIVTIVYDSYVNKIKNFKSLEDSAGIGVTVNKNLFIELAPDSEPSPNLDDLVRYIDWVVTKPSANYEQRLIDTTYLGVWEIPGLNPPDTNIDIPPAPSSPPINLDFLDGTTAPPRPASIGGGTPTQGGTTPTAPPRPGTGAGSPGRPR
jgi:hypothetical protein